MSSAFCLLLSAVKLFISNMITKCECNYNLKGFSEIIFIKIFQMWVFWGSG